MFTNLYSHVWFYTPLCQQTSSAQEEQWLSNTGKSNLKTKLEAGKRYLLIWSWTMTHLGNSTNDYSKKEKIEEHDPVLTLPNFKCCTCLPLSLGCARVTDPLCHPPRGRVKPVSHKGDLPHGPCGIVMALCTIGPDGNAFCCMVLYHYQY